ncbi:unnamed protein product [Scytosiphon promiscuus]
MIAATQRFLLGACLFAGRSSAFNVPVASSLPGRSRLPLADAGHGKAARSNSASLRRRVHSTGVVMAAATSGVMQETIETRLTEALSPVHLEVINESDKHAGPAKESHFKVVVVSEEFEGKPLLARHRMVNALFESEMKGVIHALSIQGKTPSQWEAEGHKVAPSPPCMGGSKADPSMGGETPTALGAALHQVGRAPRRQRGGRLQAIFLQQRRRHRRGSNLAPACLYAGLFAVAALLSCPAATSAATPVATSATNAAAWVELMANVDEAFWFSAESLGRLMSREIAADPIRHCTQMFYTAWITKCIGPVPAAGALQQPLGRAMLATASSHACYAACSFLAAAFALSTFTPLSMTPTRGFGRDAGSPEAGPHSAPKPVGARNNRQRSGRPSLKLPSPLAPSKRRGPPGTAPTGPPVTRIQVRRSARSVPKVWLMAATVVGGPAMGALGAAVSWKAGLVAIPAALSSLSRGAAFSVLLAGTLCYGGAGTAFVARWAVFQGILGGLLSWVMFTPFSLMVVFMCNYGRMVTDRRRRGPMPPRGGMRGKGGKGASGLGANREGGDADGNRPEKRKEGGNADDEEKERGKDK